MVVIIIQNLFSLVQRIIYEQIYSFKKKIITLMWAQKIERGISECTKVMKK